MPANLDFKLPFLIGRDWKIEFPLNLYDCLNLKLHQCDLLMHTSLFWLVAQSFMVPHFRLTVQAKPTI